MATNADLFASLGVAQLATRAVIDVYYTTSPLVALHAVSENLRKTTEKWERIRALEVNTTANIGIVNSSTAPAAGRERAIYATSHALASLMPGLQRLQFSGSNESTIVRAICGCLADFYTDQLQYFRSTRAVVLSREQRFSRLQQVSIDYDSDGLFCIPRMQAGELRQLSMRGMPANHSWRTFAAADDSQEIAFTRLRSLQLLYNRVLMDSRDRRPVVHEDGHPWALHFPALETAAIHCTLDVCPVLDYAVFPARMGALHIEARPAVFRSISRRGLPTAKRLSLEISRGSDADSTVFGHLNKILETARGAEQVALISSDRDLRVVSGDITSRTLTRLEVSGQASVSTMIWLVGNLPNLTHLALWGLTLEGSEADVSVPEPGASKQVAPLSTKLARLAISCQLGHYTPARVASVLVSMMIRVPRLATLAAPYPVKERLAGLVQSLAPQFPHLATVNLDLC
ncbi:hypothetical protein H4R19_000878 [Coemansia spiralis]|nr:hypothetical protein H4R19_000878 [Coemansia spiralis]